MKHLPQRVAALLLAAVMSLTLTGCRQICADGEVQECRQIQLSVLPGAVLYRV